VKGRISFFEHNVQPFSIPLILSPLAYQRQKFPKELGVGTHSAVMSQILDLKIQDDLVAVITHSGRLYELVVDATSKLEDSEAERVRPNILSYEYTDTFDQVTKEFNEKFLTEIINKDIYRKIFDPNRIRTRRGPGVVGCEGGIYPLSDCLAGIFIPLPKENDTEVLAQSRGGSSVNIASAWGADKIIIISGQCDLHVRGEGRRIFIFIGLRA